MRVWKFILNSIYSYRFYLYGMLFITCIIAIDANIRPYLIKMLIDAAIKHKNNILLLLIVSYAGGTVKLMENWI